MPSTSPDTIFALSSGAPPAAIAIIRISGPQAGAVLTALAGRCPDPRRAVLRTLRHPADGGELDQALLLYFPGPATATGEDLGEIHAHGGRAVVQALLKAIAALPGLRAAQPGEFTRRALLNGRIDLAEAEGLADLLSAETERQRVQALAMAGGALSQLIDGWQDRLLGLSAQVEALLDFADEDDVGGDGASFAPLRAAAAMLARDVADWLARPAAERLRDGISVAIAGPPNSGKSTLLNALAQREVAIVSPLAGTTRDVVEVPLALDGIPFRFADTAGLREAAVDPVERIGIARAEQRVSEAELVLWLGDPADAPDHPALIRLAAQADRRQADPDWPARLALSDIALSAATGEGMEALHRRIVALARDMLPREGEVALNQRQRGALSELVGWLQRDDCDDPLVFAEQLRLARQALDGVTGRAGTEAMLNALFGRFCIGK